MWRNVLTVYRKELLEVARDRKTLFFMLVLPTLFVPFLASGMMAFIINAHKKAESEILTFAIFGDRDLPELATAFTARKKFERINLDSVEDVAEAVRQERIQFGLVIPDSGNERLERGEQLDLEFYFNNASAMSMARQRAGEVIEEVGKRFQSRRLEKLGFDTQAERDRMLEPLRIVERGTADMRELIGERLGGMLPYLFIIFCFMGAMYPAIDLGAGEKERGTLETLLSAPVPRGHLVLGKFMVIFTTGVIASLLCLTGLGGWLALKKHALSGMEGEAIDSVVSAIIASISAVDLMLIGLMLAPTAAIFASLLLSISIYARSFKEAASYCTPLNMLCILPAVLAILPGVELDWFWACVPITNIALAIKELIKGTMDYQMLVAILGSSVLIAGVLLWFCACWFEREAVLFRE